MQQRKGSAKYRMMCNQLDAMGKIIHIHYVGPKRYELHLNYEIVKQYKKRQSCNDYITKLYKTLCYDRNR